MFSFSCFIRRYRSVRARVYILYLALGATLAGGFYLSHKVACRMLYGIKNLDDCIQKRLNVRYKRGSKFIARRLGHTYMQSGACIYICIYLLISKHVWLARATRVYSYRISQKSLHRSIFDSRLGAECFPYKSLQRHNFLQL